MCGGVVLKGGEEAPPRPGPGTALASWARPAGRRSPFSLPPLLLFAPAQIVVRLQPDEAIYLKLIVKRPGERETGRQRAGRELEERRGRKRAALRCSAGRLVASALRLRPPAPAQPAGLEKSAVAISELALSCLTDTLALPPPFFLGALPGLLVKQAWRRRRWPSASWTWTTRGATPVSSCSSLIAHLALIRFTSTLLPELSACLHANEPCLAAPRASRAWAACLLRCCAACCAAALPQAWSPRTLPLLLGMLCRAVPQAWSSRTPTPASFWTRSGATSSTLCAGEAAPLKLKLYSMHPLARSLARSLVCCRRSGSGGRRRLVRGRALSASAELAGHLCCRWPPADVLLPPLLLTAATTYGCRRLPLLRRPPAPRAL